MRKSLLFFILFLIHPLYPQDMIPLESGVILRKRVEIAASPRDVFDRLSTKKGLEMFFAPHARIELAVNGPFELLFDAHAPAGDQGSEGCRILSFVPSEMISFSWISPPRFRAIRHQSSWVVITLTSLPENRTQVDLVHLGFRIGPDWTEALKYFDRDWNIVLSRLVHSFSIGPIDWKNPYTPAL